MKGPPGKPFRILRLDGGGIRGAFSAAFLAEVERRTGISIAEHFDLIAGTSTGAIIAAALARGQSAAIIEELYAKHGKAIFTRRSPVKLGFFDRRKARHIEKKYLKPYGLDYDQVLQSKYESTALDNALKSVLGRDKLEDAKVRLIIPAFDLTGG
ncbi:MAG: patatin-like phospholipase family protein, partial [Planctomycetaceae bacterium]|nr:patatin-like phospholipase family protein [Planctomycetaceae bacterium]